MCGSPRTCGRPRGRGSPSGRRSPRAGVQRIADEARKATLQPDVQARVAAMGFEIQDSSPEAFAAAYRLELPVWERLVKQSGARLE